MGNKEIKMQADMTGKDQHKSTREKTERGRGLTEREKNDVFFGTNNVTWAESRAWK